MKQLEIGSDPGAVPGDSTISRFLKSVFDGVEIGLTDGVGKWRLSDDRA